MKVERISTDFIKPSTPTPDHLRRFNLSLLDQLSPPLLIPIILFYSSPTSTTRSLDDDADNDNQLGVSDRLKKSLSETLTRFFPLAGRIKDNLYVDCNDEGVEYFESRINGNVSDFMKRDELHHLQPYDLHSTLKIIDDKDAHLIIQVNLFDCGGIAICVCISHKIADAATLTTFINTWASITCCDGDHDDHPVIAESIVSPTFDSAILYPPREAGSISSSFSTDALFDELVTKQQTQRQAEKIVARRFVFGGTKITTLRARYGEKNKCFPTRVEAVIALIWKTAMAASSSQKPSLANISVEMRRRLDPPLPEQSFGNLSTMVTVAALISTTEEMDLVGSLRESIYKINNDSLKVIQGDEDGHLKFQEFMKMDEETCGKSELYQFTSWCRFPLYEADFGWGKPNWVATGSQPFFKNFNILMDNKTGDGIEAWICMLEEDMAIFEHDQDLLDFISFVD